MLTKSKFCQILNNLKKQIEYDQRCVNAYKGIFPNDEIAHGHNNKLLYNIIFDWLITELSDSKEYSLIEQHVYHGNSIRVIQKGMVLSLKSPEEIYDFLIKNV